MHQAEVDPSRTVEAMAAELVAKLRAEVGRPKLRAV